MQNHLFEGGEKSILQSSILTKIMAKPITLSQLLGAVEKTFDEIFTGHIFPVLAETGDIKNYPDRQYCFFSLIEKKNGETVAKADAVIWRSHYPIISRFERTTGRRFEKNIQILLHVEVGFHPVFGMRLRVTDIDPNYTLGQIEMARQQVLENLLTLHPDLVELRNGEYRSQNQRIALPTVIKNIALITAPDSDGLRDFMHELESNAYGYTFRVKPFLTRIQGQGAEADICKALRAIADAKKDFDLVVLVRGGGSGLDLGPFDTYELARDIAAFSTPVITGIGHERNVSIADLMSHTKVKTPTKAASFIIEHNVAFEEHVLALNEMIQQAAEKKIRQLQMDLLKISSRLIPSARQALAFQNHRLDKLEQAALMNHPQRILAMGYALVRKNGKSVQSSTQLQTEDKVEIVLHDGTRQAQIT